MVLRGIRHESEVLLRQVDGRLVTLGARGRASESGRAAKSGGADLELAERVAEQLRRLVAQTSRSSAAERARVRAAVHYFVGLRNTRERRPQRSLADDIRVVEEMVRELPRRDVVWQTA